MIVLMCRSNLHAEKQLLSCERSCHRVTKGPIEDWHSYKSLRRSMGLRNYSLAAACSACASAWLSGCMTRSVAHIMAKCGTDYTRQHTADMPPLLFLCATQLLSLPFCLMCWAPAPPNLGWPPAAAGHQTGPKSHGTAWLQLHVHRTEAEGQC